MMPRFASQAAYYRHQRKVFALALEMGVTPREAELELKRRAVRSRWSSTEERLRAAPASRSLPPAQPTSFEDWDAPHMMRN